MGTSNYGIGRTVSVALDIVYLYFSRRYLDRPLKAFGKLAILFFGSSVAILSVLMMTAYLTGLETVRSHSGWFLLSLVLLLASLQLLLAGILAEIIVRIYYGVRGNDGYVVRRE